METGRQDSSKTTLLTVKGGAAEIMNRKEEDLLKAALCIIKGR